MANSHDKFLRQILGANSQGKFSRQAVMTNSRSKFTWQILAVNSQGYFSNNTEDGWRIILCTRELHGRDKSLRQRWSKGNERNFQETVIFLLMP